MGKSCFDCLCDDDVSLGIKKLSLGSIHIFNPVGLVYVCVCVVCGHARVCVHACDCVYTYNYVCDCVVYICVCVCACVCVLLYLHLCVRLQCKYAFSYWTIFQHTPHRTLWVAYPAVRYCCQRFCRNWVTGAKSLANGEFIWMTCLTLNCPQRGTGGDQDPRWWRQGRLFLTQLSPPGWCCMKMGSDEIHVNNVLFSVRGKGELNRCCPLTSLVPYH